VFDTQEIRYTTDILIRRNPLEINLENELSDWSICTYNMIFKDILKIILNYSCIMC